MVSQPISPSAQLALTFLALSNEQRDAVTKYVTNYSRQDGNLVARCRQLVYFLLEHISTYMGCSDKQKATAALQEKSIALIPSACLNMIGQSNLDKANKATLNALTALNGCQFNISESANHFIVTHCNVDILSKAITQLVSDTLQQCVEYSKQTAEEATKQMVDYGTAIAIQVINNSVDATADAAKHTVESATQQLWQKTLPCLLPGL
jgi:hypothetical protein